MKLQMTYLKSKKWIALSLVLVLLVSFFSFNFNTYAETNRIGVIQVSNSLNFRSGPGTEYGVIGTLRNGDSGPIIGEATSTQGKVWYKMTISGKTGWASSSYVVVKVNVTQEGFPESYKAGIKALQERYPNWVFEPQYTGLDWKDVIEAESALRKNLIQNTSSTPSSWKSIEINAYDWVNDKWKVFDGSNWVAASSGIIAYYMDPRNFLDSTYIFQFLKQSYTTAGMTEQDLVQKKNGLINLVQGSFLAGTCDEGAYVDILMEAGKQSGVDPYILAAMIRQEQGSAGTSGSISGTVAGYEGYYNFFNVGATDGDGAIIRGLQKAKEYGWDTRLKSIVGGAGFYAESYIKKGQDTLYLKKFNVQGNNLYEHQYMTNVQGAASEGKITAQGYPEVDRNRMLVFKIPVFENMPATACPKPTGDGNPNVMLKSLEISGYSLTPTFDMYTTNYDLIVEHSVSSVSISASTYNEKTRISGTGAKSLGVGNNVVHIKTTAESGNERTYTITIVRKEANGAVTPTPPPTVTGILHSSVYRVDSTSKIVSGISTLPVDTSTFASQFSSDGFVKVVKADGSAHTGNIATGNKVQVCDAAGNVKSTYTVLIYGDVNGDGKINARDLLSIQKNNIKVQALGGAYVTAADVNRDGKVNARDLLAVQKHNIKITSIQQ